MGALPFSLDGGVNFQSVNRLGRASWVILFAIIANHAENSIETGGGAMPPENECTIT